MKNKLFNIILFVFPLIFLSCFSSPPVWVQKRPNNPEYWHGIGYAKQSESNNPKILAREYAIHEISSQIKINITSELDIVVNDFNGSIDNAIKSVMNSRVDLLLPELEFMDSYKVKDGVYFYVRLNKLKYQNAMARLRENARLTALDYIKKSENKFGSGSFFLIQKAWQEIYPFNDEPMEVNYRNKKHFLYSLIKQKLEDFNSRVSISASLSNNKIRSFVDRNTVLIIKVVDMVKGDALKGMPIKIVFPDSQITFSSDKHGLIEYGLDSFIEPSSFQIKLELDHEELMTELDDISNRLKPNRKINSISIDIIPSKVLIISNEKNLNKPLQNSLIAPAIKESLSMFVEFVDENPDFHIIIDVNTVEKSKPIEKGFPFFTYGNASVIFKDMKSNEEFFNIRISNIKGGDFGSQRAAGLRAYDKMVVKLIEDLEKRLFDV